MSAERPRAASPEPIAAPGGPATARGPQWLIVARREFWERVRTKWFAIVTVLGPIGLATIIVLPAYLQARSADKDVHVQMIDRTTEKLGEVVRERLPENYQIESVAADTSREELTERIRDEAIDGFLILPEDTLTGGTVVYEGHNTSNVGLVTKLQVFITSAVIEMRARRVGVSDEDLVTMLMPIGFDARQNTGEEETGSVAGSFLLGIVVMMLLYMAIVFYAVNVMRSVVQEKTSRVVEIMVSAVKPRSLMLGKILGVGTVGLLQLSIWAGFGLLLLTYQSQFLGLFGISGASVADVPSIHLVDLLVVLGYFFGGYFFYAALYAAVGAMVNSDQEAQQAQMPVLIPLIIPVVCFQLVASDPRGGAAELLTMIPFSSPVLMPMRYLLGGASGIDVAISLAILAVALIGAVWLSGRIYRVGILMYGKRPNLRELIRWLGHE